MQRIILVYGIIAGLIIIGSAMLGLAFSGGAQTTHATLEWLGYLIMLVALSCIFVGIKRYRDQQLGGVIRFGRATLLGLGIAAIASVVYVISWEIYLLLTDHAFINEYVRGVIAAKQAEGLSGAELEALVAEMEAMKQQYANPLFRVPVTFLEIFPVGLLVTLVSAGILRNPRVLPAISSANA